MKRVYLGTQIILSVALSACSGAELDSGSESDELSSDQGGTGGQASGAGGSAAGTGGSSFGSGGTSIATGGQDASIYHPGFQSLMDVLSGFRIGRPDYSCASADCHSGGHDHSAVPLRLVEEESLYAELTTHVSVKCGNLKVVEPGSPEGSAILKVLKEGCDDVMEGESAVPRMPYDCVENEFENTCVADEHIAAIEEWIAAGAPEFPQPGL